MRPLNIALSCILLSGCTEIISRLAPSSEALEGWAAHDPNSTVQLDHSEFAAILQKSTTDRGGILRFDYANADKGAVERYVKKLLSVQPGSLNRHEQLAYWINLYNAATLQVVLDHYPVPSIKEIELEGSGLFGGPWNAKLFEVNGQRLSLNDIEHGILRPYWKDPRIHYAVNCASIGCPNLLREPYTAANVEERLNQQARAFINHPRGVSVNDDSVQLSEIFRWYRSDFGGSDETILEHVRLYADPELKKSLEGVSSVDSYDYDWRLNAPDTQYPAAES